MSIYFFPQLLGTLRFVRRWVVLGRVLQRAWRELWSLTVLLLLLLALCIHLGSMVQEEKFKFPMKMFVKRKCVWYASVFVLALLPFGGRFPVSTSDHCLGAVNLAWSDGSPRTLQCSSNPWAYLWAPSDGRSCLAPSQTLWSCSHSHI